MVGLNEIAIAIAASGLVILSTHPYKYYSLHLFDSQFIYLRATECGICVYVFCTFLLRGIRLLAGYLKPLVSTSHVWNQYLERFYATSFDSDTVLTCFIVAFIWGKCAKRWLAFESKRWEIKTGSSVPALIMLLDVLRNASLDKFLMDAMIDQHPLLFTLKTSEVYVGFPVALQAPSEKDGPNKELLIQPILKGYPDLADPTRLSAIEPMLTSTSDIPSANLVLIRREDILQLKPIADFKRWLRKAYKLKSQKSSIETADSICPTK